MSDAAKLLANVIRLQTSNMTEAMVLVSETMKELVSQERPVPTPVFSKPINPPVTVPEVKVAKPRVVYAKAGHTCSCDACGKDAFKIVKDVYDDMPTGEFIAAFSPVGTVGKINPEWDYQNIDGCMMTKCPNCAVEDGLILWGKRPQARGIAPGGTVTSLGAEQVGSL